MCIRDRRRLELARAVATKPRLLLLDEPAAGLDLPARENLLEGLTLISQDPSAPPIVLVTHHVEEVPAGFTHVLFLREGSVVAAGPIEETLNDRSLSDTFGMQLKLHKFGGRWSATAT